MEFYLLTALYTLLLLSDHGQEPTLLMWKSRQQPRHLDCERMSQAEAHERYPGHVPETHARMGTFATIDALVCKQDKVKSTQREAKSESILSTLSQSVTELTQQANARFPQKRWMIDAFFPDATMTQKIAGAARTAMATSGATVSETTPLLAGGDLWVLFDLPLKEALPVACTRLIDEGELQANEAFLAIATVAAAETDLHGGVCTTEGFVWLR